MRLASPLRYPGGKAAMAGLLAETRRLNALGDLPLAEPFAGGAGASLSLLYREEVSEIYINDADAAMHDFWWTLCNRAGPFLERITTAKVNLKEWKRQKAIYRQEQPCSRLARGFAAFYLNRCNRSGIIMNGGPIGGIHQTGTWKIDARFNKSELRSRCERVAEYRDRMHVSGLDGLEFIRRRKSQRTFYFIDPPYFEKGPTLYLNTLDHVYHKELGRELKTLSQPWILTYDDCPEIRHIYAGWAQVRPFALRYAASERRQGRELLIAPKNIRLPATQSSAAIDW
jgi:DNA adenine methylase